jgi:dienelactone hydrolase
VKRFDSLIERFDKLAPGIEVFNPKGAGDQPLPAVLLFHGCGGRRPHLDHYADVAAKAGVRAFVIDSFSPRGWNRAFAVTMVCTGVVMQGYERSGDVLAALYGISQRPDVDATRLVIVGESHGGWSIMDLMTQDLTKSGDAKLHDPDPQWLAGIKGAFLIYPYINFPARSNGHGWHYKPKTMAVLAMHDHLTPFDHAKKVFGRLQRAGLDYRALELDATHAFDEPEFGPIGPMRYDPVATEACQNAWEAFLKDVLAI